MPEKSRFPVKTWPGVQPLKRLSQLLTKEEDGQREDAPKDGLATETQHGEYDRARPPLGAQPIENGMAVIGLV